MTAVLPRRIFSLQARESEELYIPYSLLVRKDLIAISRLPISSLLTVTRVVSCGLPSHKGAKWSLSAQALITACDEREKGLFHGVVKMNISYTVVLSFISPAKENSVKLVRSWLQTRGTFSANQFFFFYVIELDNTK